MVTLPSPVCFLECSPSAGVDLRCERHKKLRDIAMLPITELRSVKYSA
jgi:hypothetical protein